MFWAEEKIYQESVIEVIYNLNQKIILPMLLVVADGDHFLALNGKIISNFSEIKI